MGGAALRASRSWAVRAWGALAAAALTSTSCQQATLFNLPRDPLDRRFVTVDGGVVGAIADGSAEDVYRRAALAGCARADDGVLTCRSLDPVTDGVQVARFAVATDNEGHVVVHLVEGALDRQGLRRWLYTLSGGERHDGTPPAPPLLPPD